MHFSVFLFFTSLISFWHSNNKSSYVFFFFSFSIQIYSVVTILFSFHITKVYNYLSMSVITLMYVIIRRGICLIPSETKIILPSHFSSMTICINLSVPNNSGSSITWVYVCFTQCTTNASITVDIATKMIVTKITMITYPTAAAKKTRQLTLHL